MTCKEYLKLIYDAYKKHNNKFQYDRDLEGMQYICEDYEEYLNNIREK